jgi:hypothetical protein
MKSPFTGGEVILIKENRTQEFRGSEFIFTYHYYKCKDTGEEFTNTALDEVNLNQVYNQYRVKEGIPFRDEIIAYRKQFEIPATKMSQILGFGINMYGKYEAGEIPSVSNGRMIQNICKDPVSFKQFIEQITIPEITAEEKRRILIKSDKAITEKIREISNGFEKHAALGNFERSKLTGFVQPDLEKARQMVLFFAKSCTPFTTKMNKLLFYADFLNYSKTGYSISGMTYLAITNGPVPARYAGLYENASDIVERVEEFYSNDVAGERLSACQDFNYNLFDKEEIKNLETIAAIFSKCTTRDIIQISHSEPGWIENESCKKPISYDYAFKLTGI